MNKSLLLLALLTAANAFAANYKWTDAQGNVHYSDKPPPEGVTVKTLPTTSAEGGTSEGRQGGPTEGSPSPLEDAHAVPYLRDGGRQVYRDFLKHPAPRAFALCPDGSFATLYAETEDGLKRSLQRYKETHQGTGCRPYAINNSVVW